MTIAAKAEPPIAEPPIEDAVGLLDGRRRGLTIGLVLVVTLVAFEALAIATVLPAVKQDLGHVRLYPWAFSAFLLANLIGLNWSGEQCDRSGPARPLAIGLALFALGLAIAGAAPSMWVLVGGRAVQGLGAGMIPAVAYVVIGRSYAPTERARMFAVLSSAWVIPGLVGPLIAGAVGEYIGWRFVFIGLLPLLVIAAALTLPALRAMPSQAGEEAAPRTRRAIVMACGAALAIAGITSGNIVLALVLVPTGALVGGRPLLQLIPSGTLRMRRGLPAAVSGNGLLNLAFFGAEAFVPLALIDVRHETTVGAGLALMAATLSWTTGSWILARVDARVDRATAVRCGLALVAAGIIGTACVLSAAVPLWLAPVAWGIAGLGMGVAYPSLSLALLSDADGGSEGQSTASFKLIESLATAMGVGAAGAIVAAGVAGDWEAGSLVVVFAVMASVAAIGVAAAGRLRSSMPVELAPTIV